MVFSDASGSAGMLAWTPGWSAATQPDLQQTTIICILSPIYHNQNVLCSLSYISSSVGSDDAGQPSLLTCIHDLVAGSPPFLLWTSPQELQLWKCSDPVVFFNINFEETFSLIKASTNRRHNAEIISVDNVMPDRRIPMFMWW